MTRRRRSRADRLRTLDPIGVHVTRIRRMNGQPYSGQRYALVQIHPHKKIHTMVGFTMGNGLEIIAVRGESDEIVVRAPRDHKIELQPGETVPLLRSRKT